MAVPNNPMFLLPTQLRLSIHGLAMGLLVVVTFSPATAGVALPHVDFETEEGSTIDDMITAFDGAAESGGPVKEQIPELNQTQSNDFATSTTITVEDGSGNSGFAQAAMDTSTTGIKWKVYRLESLTTPDAPGNDLIKPPEVSQIAET